MAFRSNSPIMLALPPFRGVTRRIILTALIAFFSMLVLALFLRPVEALLMDHLMLHPDDLRHGMIWQLVSWPFMMDSIFSLLFALLSIWFLARRWRTIVGRAGSRSISWSRRSAVGF